MPEMLSSIIGVTTIAKPALDGLAGVIRALKEPLGKRKVEQMRQELLDAMEGLSQTLSNLEQDLVEKEKQIEILSANIVYLRLPFWKRWTATPPTALPNYIASGGPNG